MTSKNKRNASGEKGETRIRNFLAKEGFIFDHSKKKSRIDFIIHLKDGPIYVDSKNQNEGGSTNEKLPHMTHKYSKQYNTNRIIVVRGKDKIPGHVLEHLDYIHKTRNVKTEIYTFSEFCNLLKYNQSSGVLDV